jgi:hypothetical protein
MPLDPTKRWLAGVVLLGAAALVALGVVWSSSRGARHAVAAALLPRASGPTVAGLTPLADEAGAADPATTLRLADAWKTLDHGDLKSLVANLRAAGFPPEVVRAIATALLRAQYEARRRQILGGQEPPPYWKTGPVYSSAQMAALRQLAREEQSAIRQLLGPDSATAEMTRLYQEREFGDLPPEKMDALQRIMSDYNDLRSQIFAAAGNGSILLPSDREKLALLAQNQREDIAALLTPDELRQYDLRSSPTAQRLRSQLAYFNPTEQEFDTLYDLQSQFDQKYSNAGALGGPPPPDLWRQRQADQAQLQAQIQAALGDQRYVDYQQSIDPSFQMASRIVNRLQLPAENAAATWSLEQSVQQQATAIRTEAGVAGAQKLAALAALDAQANQQLTALLTPTGVEAYKQTSGGFWLRNLDRNVRRLAPPPPPGGH